MLIKPIEPIYNMKKEKHNHKNNQKLKFQNENQKNKMKDIYQLQYMEKEKNEKVYSV